MKIVNYHGQQVAVFENMERIKIELEENGCVDVPAALKEQVIGLLKELGRGYELFDFLGGEYLHIMNQPEGVAIECPF
ncbi:hypothetical protein A374_08959 [Fictibacillus macauensis ZFHKF-1]|uniref:Uncharacterized protein n=1 Tax=Fictibacillus macauensis ZFHKF-1 TaxID=1196324 RepID=I8UGN7_9BACL|nr:hypothetical protein [Fictibacillus macauensis]EIT85953.1 hypothetical protein A374_08959 [Fictibacillus macauensis ZFHKF-1]